MKSYRKWEFIKLLNELPVRVQELALKNFELWKENPRHPSLNFENVGGPRWSVRIGAHHRAVGEKRGDVIVWYWIGAHESYNKLF